ncbi:response regulator [Methanocella sp. CWC-04]|uniref:Response regulator n=1 Tax=Methanooceanicella nereidis TaxID=2052831 RepID=A0AAP2RE50_9EURY|nr:response regulator [Methanocella sp. CWC-04]MCD1295492.1 response regulator [Methanocella sp. CWC-04]
MRSILLVDDNIELVSLYKRVLVMMGGYTIAGIAHRGDDAIKLYREMKVKPDLIIMDVNMPGIDGISAADEILRYGGCKTKILFATSDYIYNKDLPPELSGSCIIQKPFSISEFLQAVKMCIMEKPETEIIAL